MQTVSVAILGYGVVGRGVAQILTQNAADIAHREALAISVSRVLLRDFSPKRDLSALPRAVFTTDFSDVVNDPSIGIVIECMGGIEPARTYILRALAAGKTVVTSNKEVVSKYWHEFHSAAQASGAGLYLEATVGGGIPILRAVTDSMQANNLTGVTGIVNGTTNFILTKMAAEGKAFSDVLSEAQRLGYAEADPTADVEGFDAMYKLSILSSLAFHAHIPVSAIRREGITGLTAADFRMADALGCRIKLLAIGRKDGQHVEVRVHPTLLKKTHPLAAVDGVFNAILLTGQAVGDVMLYGRGAGALPTASAVVSDVVSACRAGDRQPHATFAIGEALSPAVTVVADPVSAFCLRVRLADAPDAVAGVVGALAAEGVPVLSVTALGAMPDGTQETAILAGKTPESRMLRAKARVAALPVTASLDSLLHAEV